MAAIVDIAIANGASSGVQVCQHSFHALREMPQRGPLLRKSSFHISQPIRRLVLLGW
jgi:hypothetical protein